VKVSLFLSPKLKFSISKEKSLEDQEPSLSKRRRIIEEFE